MSQDHPSDRNGLEKSEERFRLLVESVKDYAIFMLDAGGHVMNWNEGARRIKGYEAGEIVGSHFSRFYPAEDIAAGKPEWELKKAIEDGRIEDEGWRIRKDGTRFWADVVITALRDPKTGELVGFGKVTRDLTERRAAEEELRRSEEQLRLLVETVSEYAIFMLNDSGHIASWNSGAQKIKGYSADEIIGQHYETFFTPEDRKAGVPFAILNEAKRAGFVRTQGTRVRKDGARFQADVLVTAIFDSHHILRGYSKITRDITDVARSREYELAKAKAETANQAKDDFLAALSHELRTPLTPVLAGATYLLENIEAVSMEELKEGLAAIRRNARLQTQLIDDLLDVTRITRGKMALKFEAVDIHAALSDALKICEQDTKEKGAKVACSLKASRHWAWADGTRIRQVFWNLINNAVKFTPPGSAIEIFTSNGDANELIVEVKDSGMGIEPENLGRIFNAFEQGGSTVTRTFGGLGLGLAITRRIVEMHEGSISVRSEGKGKGARFFVTIPRATDRPADGESALAGPTSGKGSLSILLVEDHADTSRILSRLIRKRGHKVEIAGSLQEARLALDAKDYDVVLSDIGLPDGSGMEVFRYARNRHPDITGVVVSGSGMDEDIRKTAEAGFEYHITKPVEIDTLLEILRKIDTEKGGRRILKSGL